VTARVLVLAAVAALPAVAARAQPVTVPGSSVEMVSVDVSVISEGRAVPGLSADRFDVRDEGARREVEMVAAGDAPLHVLLVLDASDSVGGERVKQLLHSAQAIFPDRDGFRHLELGQAVFVTCNCDGKFGNVIVLTRCSMAFPSANGFIPTDRSRGREGIRKCRDGQRECA